MFDGDRITVAMTQFNEKTAGSNSTFGRDGILA